MDKKILRWAAILVWTIVVTWSCYLIFLAQTPAEGAAGCPYPNPMTEAEREEYNLNNTWNLPFCFQHPGGIICIRHQEYRERCPERFPTPAPEEVGPYPGPAEEAVTGNPYPGPDQAPGPDKQVKRVQDKPTPTPGVRWVVTRGRRGSEK